MTSFTSELHIFAVAVVGDVGLTIIKREIGLL